MVLGNAAWLLQWAAPASRTGIVGRPRLLPGYVASATEVFANATRARHSRSRMATLLSRRSSQVWRRYLVSATFAAAAETTASGVVAVAVALFPTASEPPGA